MDEIGTTFDTFFQGVPLFGILHSPDHSKSLEIPLLPMYRAVTVRSYTGYSNNERKKGEEDFFVIKM